MDFSALLAFCSRNSPVTGEFPAHVIVMFELIVAINFIVVSSKLLQQSCKGGRDLLINHFCSNSLRARYEGYQTQHHTLTDSRRFTQEYLSSLHCCKRYLQIRCKGYILITLWLQFDIKCQIKIRPNWFRQSFHTTEAKNECLANDGLVNCHRYVIVRHDIN